MIRLLPQKTSPLDIIPVSLLKLSADAIAPLIARLANLSFANDAFPSRYKVGQMIPLLKKSGLPTHDPANYKPISNLCTFSKILEKLFLLRLLRKLLQVPVGVSEGLLHGDGIAQGDK